MNPVGTWPSLTARLAYGGEKANSAASLLCQHCSYIEGGGGQHPLDRRGWGAGSGDTARSWGGATCLLKLLPRSPCLALISSDFVTQGNLGTHSGLHGLSAVSPMGAPSSEPLILAGLWAEHRTNTASPLMHRQHSSCSLDQLLGPHGVPTGLCTHRETHPIPHLIQHRKNGNS